MQSSELPTQVDDVNSSSSLLGRTVEGDVTIDQGTWLDEARAAIASVNPTSDSDRVAFAEDYVRAHLKDAIFAFKSDPRAYEQNQAAIDRVLTSKGPRSLSKVLAGGFGVCPDFQALELVLLDQMRMEAYLAGNPTKQHLFIFVKEDGVWVVSDPFAQSYFAVRGSESKRFAPDYYQGAGIKLFDKTSHAKEAPPITPLPTSGAKPKSQATISLADLRARISKR
ncbi:hypothetical protein HYS93_03750 [Candidatus Daviesbacteria bacterium]|nr:hypothetical protein [Candidatus Daviesbacteria bacterium]